MTENWQPLELELLEVAQSKKSDFPNQHLNYWERYTGLLSNLRAQVYPYINSGLSCLSKSPSFYTDHDGRHFDEVVRYAGLLLDKSSENLNPLELYLLLCAIRLHDAGNIDGRDEHETKAFWILKQYGGVIHMDAAEHQMIANIAQAHGGKRANTNDKDTIGGLLEKTEMGPIEFRPRLIAAIVRFADEICEHSSRATSHHINNNNLPDVSKLYQYYAKSIQAAKPDRINKAFKIRFYIDVGFFKDKYPAPENKQKYFIDDLLDRIDKLNHERVYCNRFLPPELRTDRIEICMEFYKNTNVNGTEYRENCETINLTIPEKEEGYPTLNSNWKESIINVTGESFSIRIW